MAVESSEDTRLIVGFRQRLKMRSLPAWKNVSIKVIGDYEALMIKREDWGKRKLSYESRRSAK